MKNEDGFSFYINIAKDSFSFFKALSLGQKVEHKHLFSEEWTCIVGKYTTYKIMLSQSNRPIESYTTIRWYKKFL